MTGARQLPEPLAQGDLSRTPFAHVLLYVHKHGLEGTLVVWEPPEGEERPRQDRILFDHGMPVAARLLERASRLDRGLLPLFARTAGPYAFYEVEDLVGAGEGVLSGQVSLLALITASLRGSSRDDVVTQVCAGFGAGKLRLERGAELDSLGLLPEERAFVDLLRAEPMTVARLVELSPLPPKMAERLVYLLAITKSVALWDGAEAPRPEREPEGARSRGARSPSDSQPDAGTSGARPRVEPTPSPARASSASPSPAKSSPASPSPATAKSSPASPSPKARRRGEPEPPPAPPAGLEPKHRALWEEVIKRAAAIESENYFEMLAVPRDAPSGAVQTAYFNAVKKWHPDRLPRELAALRSHIELIFHHLTRAQETLSDDAKRGPYLTSVQDGGGTPAADRQLAQIIQAAMEFRKVEIHLKRRELDEALQLVEECLLANEDEPDYHAARGWILFQKASGTTGHTEALGALDRALAVAPNHDRAYYYRGMVLERMGRARDAADCFRRAAELNPKNIEAVRKVRIADMRGEVPEAGKEKSPGKESSKDSLFGKLFGRKK